MIGDMHGLNTLKHQPAKIAAIEGHWENIPGEPTPLLLFGWPDMQQERTRYGLEIPALGSLILTHSLDKQVPALKEFAAEDRPNATIVFWSFRLMAGLGMLMILLGALAHRGGPPAVGRLRRTAYRRCRLRSRRPAYVHQSADVYRRLRFGIRRRL